MNNSTELRVPSDESNFGKAKVPVQSVVVDGIGVLVVNGPEIELAHEGVLVINKIARANEESLNALIQNSFCVPCVS